MWGSCQLIFARGWVRDGGSRGNDPQSLQRGVCDDRVGEAMAGHIRGAVSGEDVVVCLGGQWRCAARVVHSRRLWRNRISAWGTGRRTRSVQLDPVAVDFVDACDSAGDQRRVLGMLGIAVGSAALSTGIKAHKDATRPAFIAVSRPGAESLAQMVLVEEGARADTTVDITKLQQLAITVFLVLAYVAICVHEFAGYGTGNPVTSPGDITSLPNFNSTFLTLLALSHAGYLAGKVPNRGALGQPGTVPGYSLANRSRDDSVSAGLDRAGLVAHRNAARKAEQQQALAKQQALADQRSSAPVPGSPSGNGPTSAGSPSGAHAYISPSDPH
jgi:hypothetical protein